MKINREIIINGISNNTEYELTGIELERAYNEYVAVHDRNEILYKLQDLEYEDIESIPEDVIADLASQLRTKMNDHMDDAVLDVVLRNEETLAPYKEKWKTYTKTVRVEAEKEYSIKARSEAEAETLWERWSEKHGRQITEDMCDEIEYNGDWDWDEDIEEDAYGDPDDADISEEDM